MSTPVEELRKLRKTQHQFKSIALEPEQYMILNGANGLQLEIEANFTLSSVCKRV
jgi:hypothetical protein